MPDSRDLYAFEISLHRLAVGPDGPDGLDGPPRPEGPHVDAWGSWRTLAVSRELLNVPLAIGFDEALGRLGRLERMYVEPDGSFVQTGRSGGTAWQVDGNAAEKDGRVLLADLKGSCPPPEFDRLLEGFGWPGERVMIQLVRAAVFLDEAVFRQHALARGAAGDGKALRPDGW
jgi:hypothetical protein